MKFEDDLREDAYIMPVRAVDICTCPNRVMIDLDFVRNSTATGTGRCTCYLPNEVLDGAANFVGLLMRKASRDART